MLQLNKRKLKLNFPCQKQVDNFLLKEKQTHYFDEKQLVRCQLGSEFTLLVTEICYWQWRFFVHVFRRKIGSQQTGLPFHSLSERDMTLAKVGDRCITKQCMHKKAAQKHCQINMADGVKNVGFDCVLQRLGTV